MLLADGFTEPDGSDETDSVTRTDFGVAQAQRVAGRVWLDFFPNGVQDNVALIPGPLRA